MRFNVISVFFLAGVRAVSLRTRWLVFSLVTVLATASQASSEPARYALLVANHTYQAPDKFAAPPTSHKDVEAMETALAAKGFKVRRTTDASRAELLEAVAAYATDVGRSNGDTVSFFFYAGHGAALKGFNVLVPTDTDGADHEALDVYGVRLRDILNRLAERAPRARHFVVLDACRNGSSKAPSFIAEERRSGMLLAYMDGGSTEHTMARTETAGPFARALSEELEEPPQFDLTFFQNLEARVRGRMAERSLIVEDGLPAAPRFIFGNGRPNSRKFCRSVAQSKSEASIRTMLASLEAPGFDNTGEMQKCARSRLEVLAAEEKRPPTFMSFVDGAPPPNSFVLYASIGTGSERGAVPLPRHGSTRSVGPSSTFTASLLRSLSSDKDVREVADMISKDVIYKTEGRLKPHVDDSLFPKERIQLRRDHYKIVRPPEALSAKLALVIGVDRYDTHWARPMNSDKDAIAVAAILRKNGFDVQELTTMPGAEHGPTEAGVRAALARVRDRITPESTVAIYFAGAGASLGGVNYIAARDAVAPETGALRRNTGWLGINDMLATLHARSPKAVVAFVDSGY